MAPFEGIEPVAPRRDLPDRLPWLQGRLLSPPLALDDRGVVPSCKPVKLGEIGRFWTRPGSVEFRQQCVGGGRFHAALDEVQWRISPG